MENFHLVNIKLKKNLVKDSRDLKDKELLVLCYLFFNTTCKHNVYTTINNMCEDIKLSTISRKMNIPPKLNTRGCGQKVGPRKDKKWDNNIV